MDANTAAEELQGKQRQCKIVRAVNMAVYAAAVALFFVPNLRPGGLALMAAGVLLHVFGARRLTEAYKEQAAAANLRYGLCAGLADFAFAPKGGLDYPGFRAWALAPIRDDARSLLCRNAFTARDGALPLTGQEATFHYPAGSGVRFLSGSLLTAGGPGGPGWLLLRPGTLEEGALAAFLEGAGFRPVPSPPEGWLLYRQEGAPELPDGVLRRAGKLEKTVSILRLSGEGAAAFLASRFYTGSKYPSIRPTAELLRQNILPEWEGLRALFRLWPGRG